jgi:hypothetical protein
LTHQQAHLNLAAAMMVLPMAALAVVITLATVLSNF